MRYITEFKIPLDVVGMYKDIDQMIEHSKKASACDLGNLIASKVGWEEKPDGGKHFALEIQCFSMKDWKEFKEKVHKMKFKGLLVLGTGEIDKLFNDIENKGLTETENKPDK